MKTIKCVNCGKIVVVRFSNQKVCSRKCAWDRITNYQKNTGRKTMQIIKDKKYEISEENEIKELNFVSFNSKGTLSFVMKDGTHYNYNAKEMVAIIDFIKEKIVKWRL